MLGAKHASNPEFEKAFTAHFIHDWFVRYMTLTATQKSSVAGEKLIRTTKDTHIVLRAMREKLDNASAEVPTTRHT